MVEPDVKRALTYKVKYGSSRCKTRLILQILCSSRGTKANLAGPWLYYAKLIMIIIIIIQFKGAIQDVYNLFTVPRTISNTYAQVVRAFFFFFYWLSHQTDEAMLTFGSEMDDKSNCCC